MRTRLRVLTAVLLGGAVLGGSHRCACGEPRGAGEETWAGTIGTHAVVACLEAGFGGGRYYYRKIGKTLELSAHATEEDVLVEREASVTLGVDDAACARWKLSSSPPGTLAGSWRPAPGPGRKGPAALPIRLSRVAAGCAAFEARRTDLPEQDVPTEGSSPLVELRRHALADVVHLRVVRGAPAEALRKVQASLDEHFRTAVAESFECPEYDESVTVSICRDLLVADFAGSSYCGGAHPNEGYVLRAFDLRTGDRVAEFPETSWFPGLPKDLSGPTDGLAARLAREVESADCLAFLAPEVYWPEAKGVVFRLWTDTRSGASCRQDVLVPWVEVEPFAAPGLRSDLRAWRGRLEGQKAVVVSPAH